MKNYLKDHHVDKTDQSGQFLAVTIKFLNKLKGLLTPKKLKKQGITTLISNKTRWVICNASRL